MMRHWELCHHYVLLYSKWHACGECRSARLLLPDVPGLITRSQKQMPVTGILWRVLSGLLWMAQNPCHAGTCDDLFNSCLSRALEGPSQDPHRFFLQASMPLVSSSNVCFNHEKLNAPRDPKNRSWVLSKTCPSMSSNLSGKFHWTVCFADLTTARHPRQCQVHLPLWLCWLLLVADLTKSRVTWDMGLQACLRDCSWGTILVTLIDMGKTQPLWVPPSPGWDSGLCKWREGAEQQLRHPLLSLPDCGCDGTPAPSSSRHC